jgi:hypothetical protein
VGNGTDWTANSATGSISEAVGSFDSVTSVSVTGVISETGTTFGPNCTNPVSNVADTFSLQLNANRFTTSTCSGAMCQGWQQFVFSNTYKVAFMQYWMINYTGACPAGWNTSGSDCWQNGAGAVAVPRQTIANLAKLRLTGQATKGGNDVVIMSTATGNLTAANQDSILNLAQGWQSAEFNVFGDGCSSQANFNTGVTLVVRTSVNEGAKLAPNCVQQGFTDETNNLDLVGTPTAVSAGALPAIVFTESNAPGGTPASCATSAGDTHLITFDGLLYDFQAAGDFLLAQADPDFIVQVRQAMVPNRNVSINRGVGTQMGKTRIAICLPMRLEINGTPEQLNDGQSMPLPDNVQLSRTGNVYVIRRKGGDIVRVQVNNGWIDLSVGAAPQATVRGLLGNANGNTGDDIALRNGTVLTQPVRFNDLYGRYADSWRVPLKDSLLCKDGTFEENVPDKPFYAGNLSSPERERGGAICTAAGVRTQSLLDACILDTAVLGTESAANFFVHAPVPITEMRSSR